jgi:hypothetical protein
MFIRAFKLRILNLLWKFKSSERYELLDKKYILTTILYLTTYFLDLNYFWLEVITV